MEFSLKFTKKDLPRIIISAVMMITGIIFTASKLADFIIWYVLLFLLTFVTVKGKNAFQIILDIVLPVLAAFFSIFVMQYINLVDHDKVISFDTKSLYNLMYHVEPTRWLYEITVVIGFYFFLRIFTMPRKFAAIFAPLPFVLLGLLDFYVFSFRGHEVLVSDIYSVQTAMNVAGQYKFPLLKPFIYTVMPYIMWILAMLGIKEEKPFMKRIFRVVVNLLAAAVVFTAFVFGVDKYSKTHTPWGWEDKGSAYNGLLMNLSLSTRSLFPDKPEGYDESSLDKLAAEKGIDINDPGKADDDSANIVVVMNESYMQLRDYLPILGYYEDPTPYWNSLEENTIHGYALSSVYGANTPNSEFEFLTSVTMGNMPAGSVPYTMFIKDQKYSIAWALRNLGYKTFAMHPYTASGWKRPVIWPLLGFQDIKFVDDFKFDNSDLYREYLSDKAAYRNLIEHLEANKGSKTFTFLVTMQNHGGYMDRYDNFPVNSYVKNVFTGETNQVNTYIELAKKSDEALKDLIEYLKAQPEKYVLVVFGDHQPSINAFTNNMSYGNNTSWQIPYIIWSNYDMDPELMETMKNDVPASSLNYLGLTALKASNIKLPAYYQLIDKLRDEVPSINSAGYYSIEDKKYHFIDDFPSPVDKQHINDYDFMRYALMFDQKSGNFENNLYNVINSTK